MLSKVEKEYLSYLGSKEPETFEQYKSRKGIFTNKQVTIELGLDVCRILAKVNQTPKLSIMNEDTFEQLVQETLGQIEKTLIEKGREYRRNSNPFHNFDEGKRLTGQLRERVIDGFALKHQISINDMLNDLEKGKNPTKEVVEEKFNDFIIYQIIKKISILDKL
jgi:hypothetical protein